MSTAKKLWLIFGPVLLALTLLISFLFAPFRIKIDDADVLKRAAVSQNPQIFKGTSIKQEALKRNYVAFFGSSEFSRLDPFHPSILAEKYNRPYRPFLLGSAGTQSLTHYFGMQGINGQLKGKKAVVVVSPQWFTKKGEQKAAFSIYYSNLQAVIWLMQAKNNMADRYAAKRLLEMPSSQTDSLIESSIKRIEAGKGLTKIQKGYLKLKYNELSHEDQIFSAIELTSDRTKKIEKETKKLPDKYDLSKLDRIAYEMGEAETNNNQFAVKNSFWNHRLKNNYKKLKGEQRKFNYTQSPEFSDFELLLQQFSKDNTNVIFIIPPINRKWSNYTGLSLSMLKVFNKKITYQLRSQGFNNIVDLSRDGSEKYFMEDTIHLGWRGWLKVNEQVDPFLSKKQKAPDYKINDFFYTKEWQNMVGEKLDLKIEEG